jgi:DNA-binding IclR family transcriptional regulator
MVAILEAVTDQSHGIGLPDLSAKLRLPRQTVHRMLRQLEGLGLVTREWERERFAVGPRLTRLAMSTITSNNRSAPLKAVLRELVDDLRETCNVGVLDGLDYVYVERIECEWPLRIHLDVGSRSPAHCLSGGKVLMSELDPELVGRLLRSRKLLPRTSRSITRPEQLEAELERVREQGFSINNQENFDGIVAVAVPIRDADGKAVAALTMHGPLPRLTLEGCRASLPRLRRAAQDVARAWGLVE